MDELNQFISEMLDAQPVDDETAQEYINEVSDYLLETEAFATEDVTVNTNSGQVSTGSGVWNDDFTRTEQESMIGDIEVIRVHDSDEMYIQLPNALGALGFGASHGSGDSTYVYGSEDAVMDTLGLSDTSEEFRGTNALLRTLENARVLETDDLIVFEASFDVDDFGWLSEDMYDKELALEGVDVILTYSKDDEQIDREVITLRYADGPNAQQLKQFVHNTSVSFSLPDKGDDNVLDISEVDGGLLGGPFGGDQDPSEMVSDMLGGVMGDEDGDDLFSGDDDNDGPLF